MDMRITAMQAVISRRRKAISSLHLVQCSRQLIQLLLAGTEHATKQDNPVSSYFFVQDKRDGSRFLRIGLVSEGRRIMERDE